MNLLNIIRRKPIRFSNRQNKKIPWNEPGFSKRMLREHLSQAHDQASRPFQLINKHVAWIQSAVLAEKSSKILDLGFGPGLYTNRLARLGHSCSGIDFSPASVTYAKTQAKKTGNACTYIRGDIRTVDYGADYDMVMFIFGEFNVFSRDHAKTILQKSHEALKHNGILLLEVHILDTVRELGNAEPSWYTETKGLFSESPHICLIESDWDTENKCASERYYIIDGASGDVHKYAQTIQGYTKEEYMDLLRENGFDRITIYGSLAGDDDTSQPDFVVIVARKK